MKPVRLLLVTDAIGGVWVYSLELANALRPFGVDAVLLVVGPSPTADQLEEAAEFRLIDSGLPLEWLDTSPCEVRRAAQAIAAFADREGADIVQVSSAALLADVAFAQPTVAAQHSCVASWWAATKGTRLPPELAWRRELVEAGLRRASCVVAPSTAFAAETSRQYDLPVLTVHNGRRTAANAHIPQGDFVFTASRLWDEGKNVATLDRAAADLDVPFQAAGAAIGPNGAKVDLSYVQLLGEISPARLRGLLAARPVYASAAVYEPFGLSVLEAAQAGCALVLSDIPTHREIWGDAATFVPPREPGAFATAIRSIMINPDERHRFGNLACSRAQLYTPERMASGMADIYARLAAPAEMAGAL
jgi:glycosyltransferase involved in cell wall biosynthesis